MSIHPHLTKTALPGLMLMLSMAAGCQRQSGSDNKEEPAAPAAQGKLVTVAVPGMT